MNCVKKHQNQKQQLIIVCHQKNVQTLNLKIHFHGIHQTIQKNSVGFIPWDGISVGKDRIPWDKDRQSVLFFAPRPKNPWKFYGVFVNII